MDDLWAWFQCIVNSHCRQYWGISKNFALFGLGSPPCQQSVRNISFVGRCFHP